MKKLISILVFIPLIAASQDGKSFKLMGRVTGITNPVDWVYLQYRDHDDFKTDSVQLKNNRYQFEGKIAEPVQARLRVKYQESEPGKKIAFSAERDMVSVFIEPGKIRVNSIDSFSNVNVRGSAAHNEFTKLNKLAKPYDDSEDPLVAKYIEYGKAKDRVNQSKMDKAIDSIDLEKNEKVYGEYVRKNPSSPLAMYALQQYAGWSIDPDKVEPIYNTLPEATQKYPSAVAFKENLEIAKKTGIGKLAMDFTQNDTLGSPVSLSSFKGHYVLVDFWASWCGPCRAENPNVVEAYKKYRDKNFHIIGVSLDRPGQKERWLKAIHDDRLAWTQVSDLKFWDNEVAKQYGIKAIPQNLLLDPDGRIIAKNLRGDELDEKLEEFIEGKKAF